MTYDCILFLGSFVDIHWICLIVCIYTRLGKVHGDVRRVDPIRNWSRSIDLLQAEQIDSPKILCNKEDWDVVRAVLNGKIDQFEILVRRYQAMVLHQARKAFKTEEEAEDFTQEVFLKAYESLSTFRGAAQFSTWIFQIAKFQLSKEFRKKKILVKSFDSAEHEIAEPKPISIVEESTKSKHMESFGT